MSNYWRQLETLTDVERKVLDGTADGTEQDKLSAAFDLIREAYERVAAPKEAQ